MLESNLIHPHGNALDFVHPTLTSPCNASLFAISYQVQHITCVTVDNLATNCQISRLISPSYLFWEEIGWLHVEL